MASLYFQLVARLRESEVEKPREMYAGASLKVYQATGLASILAELIKARGEDPSRYLKPEALLYRDSPGHFVSWLCKNEPVYGHVFKGYWFDIGTPKTYEEACRLM